MKKDRKKEMKSDKLASIMRDLRRMIADEDTDNEFTQALSDAIVYLDYAKVQVYSKDGYKIIPVIVARGLTDKTPA